MPLAAEQSDEGFPCREREGVPAGDVEPCHRHAHDALHADQLEAARNFRPEIGGNDAIALHAALDFPEHGRDRRGRGGQIAEQIGMAGDAFLGLEVDEEERRAAQCSRAGAEGQFQRHLDPGRADRAQREPRLAHAGFPPSAYSARMSHTARLAGVGTPATAPSCTTPPESHSTSSRLPR